MKDVDISVNFTDEQLLKLANDIDKAVKKGIPMKDALQKAGVPDDVYYSFKKRQKKLAQLDEARKARSEKVRTGKQIHYNLETFAPVYEKGEQMKKDGVLSPEVYKTLNINAATYNKWKKLLEEKRNSEKYEQRAAKVNPPATKAAPAPSKSTPDISHDSIYAKLHNENRILRDAVADLTIENQMLKKNQKINGMRESETDADPPAKLPYRDIMRERNVNPTKLAIFDAAVSLFSAQGFGGASVRDIADIVGVTAGALYHHYPSKDDILADIFDTYEANKARYQPSMDALLAEVGMVPPHDTLRKASIFYPEKIYPFMVKALSIANSISMSNSRADGIITGYIQGTEKCDTALLTKMMELNTIEPLDVVSFCYAHIYFSLSVSLLHLGKHGLSPEQGLQGLESILHIVKAKEG